MAPPKRAFEYEYGDIQRLTGKPLNYLYQSVARGELKPDSLESVISFVLRYAEPEAKFRMATYAFTWATGTASGINSFGPGDVAKAAGLTRDQVKQDFPAGLLDMESLESVVKYILLRGKWSMVKAYQDCLTERLAEAG